MSEFLKIDQLNLFVDKEKEENLTEIQCSSCKKWFHYDKWVINRIPLDEKIYGKNATHIRLECPNCKFLFDHRDKENINLATKSELIAIG